MNVIKNFFNRGPKHEKIDIASRFKLANRLGQGSMSKVWKAHDNVLGMTVALKVLDGVRTRRFESRFKGLEKPSEGEVAVTLNHSNIVRTFEYGWTSADEQFLVMEYVPGQSLSLLVDLQNDTMKKHRLSYMIQIGAALSHFHQQNWIHRDICPRNILVTDDNEIKLIDFGLAVPNTPDFQKPGNRTGTAAYMAPELIKRQRTDQRIDIFSFAVTCYEMYTKRYPWEAALTIEAVLQHVNKPPTPIKELIPKLNDDIAGIIMKGLEAHPDDRWKSAAEMTHALRTTEKQLLADAKAALAKKKKATAAAKAKARKKAQAPDKTSADSVKDAPAPAPAPEAADSDSADDRE